MEPKRLAIVVIAVIAVLASIVSIWRGRTTPAEEVQAGIAKELGAIVAEETVRMLEGKGKVVVITRPMTEVHKNKIKGEVKSFRGGLKGVKGIEVSAVEGLTPADFEGVPALMLGKGVPAAALLRLLETHAGVDALVLLAGQPVTDDSLESIAERPKIICINSPMLPLKPVFDSGLLDVAVVRAEPAAEGDGPQPRYKAVTQETADELPY